MGWPSMLCRNASSVLSSRMSPPQPPSASTPKRTPSFLERAAASDGVTLLPPLASASRCTCKSTRGRLSAAERQTAASVREVTYLNIKLCVQLYIHSRRQFLQDLGDECLGIAEQHQGLIHVIQIVVDAGEAGIHGALDHHDGVGLVDVQNRHAENRARFIGARSEEHTSE